MSSELALFLVGALVVSRLVALGLRGGLSGALPYVALLVTDLIALGVARARGDENGAIAFTAECAGALLALAPELLDGIEVHAARRGRSRILAFVARLREVLVPGGAATSHRRAAELGARAEHGGLEGLLPALREAVARAVDPAAARQAHAELVLVELQAGRAADALDRAQRHLDHDAYLASPRLAAALCTALLETGRAREATVLLALLERQAVTADLLTRQLLLDTRVCFVAGAARPEAVERLLADEGLRATWSAKTAARARAIAAAAAAHGTDDAQLADAADELASWMLAQHAQLAAPLRRRAPVTFALVLVNLAIFATVLGLGLGDDDLGLARAGALFRPAVLAGEWWRLVSATFLHADLFHLGVNMYGLFLLGRLTEDLLGGARLFVVYALAGLGGGLASMWADRGLSVGASGSLMGLLGALIVIALARRQVVQRAVHRAFLGGLLLMVVLQVLIGIAVPMIDGAAHAGGFVAGAVATLGLAPARPLKSRALVAVALLFALAFAGAGALAARRRIEQTILALPTMTIEVHGVRLDVPRSWRRDDQGLLVDPHLGIELAVSRDGDAIKLASPSSPDARVRPLLERIAASAHPASQTP